MFEIIGSVLGGLLGGGGSESSQTSNKIDDRLAPYVYGKNGQGGLLGDIQKLYQQQMGQGGLNDMQRAGMEGQRQVLTSPQYSQGYDAMRSLGMGLMGGGVAQNPFNSGGGMGGGQMQQPIRPNTNMQYQPFVYQGSDQGSEAISGALKPIQSVSQYQAMQPQTAAPEQQTVDEMIDAYMKANGLGKYAGTGPGTSPYLSDL